MDSGLLDVPGDAGDKSVSVLKVGVEVGLLKKQTNMGDGATTVQNYSNIFF